MNTQCKTVPAVGLQIDWRPLLPRIEIPCLNLIGCKNSVFPPDGTKVVSQLVPRCAKVESCLSFPYCAQGVQAGAQLGQHIRQTCMRVCARVHVRVCKLKSVHSYAKIASCRHSDS